MNEMKPLSAFLLITWIAVMMVMLFASIFLAFRHQNRITGRSDVRSFLISILVNFSFLTLLSISVGISLEQSACLVAELLFFTVVGAVYTYKAGKRMEKIRGDITERTPLKMQDVGHTDEEGIDEK